jgi:hypothetical protein
MGPAALPGQVAVEARRGWHMGFPRPPRERGKPRISPAEPALLPTASYNYSTLVPFLKREG